MEENNEQENGQQAEVAAQPPVQPTTAHESFADLHPDDQVYRVRAAVLSLLDSLSNSADTSAVRALLA